MGNRFSLSVSAVSQDVGLWDMAENTAGTAHAPERQRLRPEHGQCEALPLRPQWAWPRGRQPGRIALPALTLSILPEALSRALLSAGGLQGLPGPSRGQEQSRHTAPLASDWLLFRGSGALPRFSV